MSANPGELSCSQRPEASSFHGLAIQKLGEAGVALSELSEKGGFGRVASFALDKPVDQEAHRLWLDAFNLSTDGQDPSRLDGPTTTVLMDEGWRGSSIVCSPLFDQGKPVAVEYYFAPNLPDTFISDGSVDQA